MKFTNSAQVLAACFAAVSHPTFVQGWSLSPMASSLFFPSPMLETMPSPRSPMQRQRAMMDRMDRVMNQQFQTLAVSSPKYEIVNNDEMFQLAVAVPGIKMEDLDVKVEDNVLTVSAHKESKKEQQSSSPEDESEVKNQRYSFTSSKFSQSFSLSDPSIDVDKLSAKLENGVLLVSAPKDMKKLEENIRTIPISASSDVGDASQQVVLESSTEKLKPATTEAVEEQAKDTITEDGLEITEEPTN